MARSVIERRIIVSGIAIAAGLVIQVVSLVWAHPLAFVVFLTVGTPISTAGTLLYLYSLAKGSEAGAGGAGG